jgi:3-hydroxyisobutyrate dehydrogenase
MTDDGVVLDHPGLDQRRTKGVFIEGGIEGEFRWAAIATDSPVTQVQCKGAAMISEPHDTTIAFLGTGQMGTPMASRLIANDFNVRAWNRTRGRLKGLIDLGAVEAETPARAADGADIIITMLTDGATVQNVMAGTDGAFTNSKRGVVWLQMGTVGVEWTDRLEQLATESGAPLVDAPVSGSVVPASSGELIILASGPSEARPFANAVFDVIGRDTFWLGAAGAGSRAKLVLNNWLVDLVEMVAETLRISEAFGLDPRVIVEILADAPTRSPYAVAKARSMLDGDFTSNFALKHAVKDAELALEAAHGVHEDLPLTDSLISTWQRAMEDGAGELELSVVYRYVGAST